MGRRHRNSNDAGVSRRELLRWAAGGVASASAFHALGSHNLLHAASGSGDYRALVVVYLAGGNDSFNLVVPTSAGAYADYADSRQNLAVPVNDLLSIQPTTSDGRTWGVHPSAPELQALFESGQMAVVANAGTLVAPVSKSEYEAGSKPLPPRLFSHNDQQSQSMRTSPDRNDALGWGGALADRLAGLNGSTPLSPSITIAGSNPLLVGQTTQAYHMGTNGSVALSGFSGTRGAALQATFDVLRNQSHTHVLERRFAQTRNEAIELDGLVSAALDAEGTVTTPFPDSNRLGDQLRMVARMVAARGALGMERQVFFVRIGGFDTHAGQLEDQPVLFAQLSQALAAFQTALAEI
ncbi:MAG: DUF1501 domain-containing protein, partial [Planctomycetota bacterium]